MHRADRWQTSLVSLASIFHGVTTGSPLINLISVSYLSAAAGSHDCLTFVSNPLALRLRKQNINPIRPLIAESSYLSDIWWHETGETTFFFPRRNPFSCAQLALDLF